MFDTHAHLNFKTFTDNHDWIIKKSIMKNVTHIVIPGTDIVTSKKAIKIAEKYDTLYAAVGIHPHHAFSYINSSKKIYEDIAVIKSLLSQPKTVAIGEIGIDKHIYIKTKYDSYSVTDKFISIQKKLFSLQIHLALEHKKSLIIHNREASSETLQILEKHWDTHFEKKSVFHCCEPKNELFNFAKQHNVFIGVDGDITYNIKKKKYIKMVPLDMLVIETDSPFLLPEPLKSQKKYPNTPENLQIIAQYVAKIKKCSLQQVVKKTSYNAYQLFSIS